MYNNKDIENGRQIMKKLLLIFLVCMTTFAFCSACSEKEEKPSFDDEKNWSGFY